MGKMHQASGNAGATSSVSADASVIRGEKSWTYLYVFVGFLVSFEGTIIQMIEGLFWPWRIIMFLIAGISTVWIGLFTGWGSNKIIGLRLRYESRAH